MTAAAGPLAELLAAAEHAEDAYAADPGSHTLPPYVQAWDRVLLAVVDPAEPGAAPELQALAAHHGAVAHLQVLRHYGDDGHARIALDLLDRLARDAPTAELRFAAVADMATARFERYLLRGGKALLRAAAEAAEEVLRQAPADLAGHRAALLANLGNVLVEQSRVEGRPELLDRAVTLHDDAVTAAGDAPYRPALLVNLATAVLARYQRDGRVADLEWAERLHDEVADGGADGQQVVLSRCDVRWERYALTGRPDVLDTVVADLRGLVAELPPDVPTFATAAGNLANALLERQSRAAVDNEALPLLDRALAYVDAGSPEHARLVHVRGSARWQRYLRTGDLSMLSAAVRDWQDAADELGPRDAARSGYLNSVAVGLLQRHAHYRADSGAPADVDLRDAVAAVRRALRGAPPRSPVAPVLWNTLGHALLAWHDRRGRRRDLDAAVDAWTRALELCADEAAARPSYLASLANGLRERAARSRGAAATADLEAALACHRRAVAGLRGSQELAGQLVNLGLTLHGLAVHTGDVRRYREAADAFARALELGLGVAPGEALRAGRAWLAMAMDAAPDWAGAAAAGSGILQALWSLLTAQLFRPAKETWLRTGVDVAATTAVAHHRSGDPTAAVLALESGRAVLLDEALPVFGRLRDGRPDLADRYATAAAAFAVALAEAEGATHGPGYPTPRSATRTASAAAQ